VNYPVRASNNSADLVFNDDIPEVVCKIVYGSRVSFLLRVLSVTGVFRYKLQLVLDPFESSETSLMRTLIHYGKKIHTRINFPVS